VIHPEDWAMCEARWRRSLETGEDYEIEYRIRRGADSSYRWHIGAALPLRNPDGSIERWFGTCTDIEQEKRATLKRSEQALRESEQRFASFMDNSPAVAWIKDSKLRWVFVSRSYEKAMGTTAARVLGRDDFERWPEELARQFRKSDLEVMSKRTPLTFVQPLPDADGNETFWLTVKFPLLDAAGKYGVGGMSIDISEQHRLERALRDSEAQMSLAMDTAQIAHWSWDVAQQRMQSSDAMASLFGLPRGAGPSTVTEWLEVVHPEDREEFVAARRESLETGNPLHHEWRVVKPDGSIAWMLSRARMDQDAEDRPRRMIGITIDITRQRSAQQELESYSNRVKQLLYRQVDAQEAERRNLASALHDLIGQKLTALNMGLDILKRDMYPIAGDLVAARLESLGTIVEETVDAIRGVMADLHPSELDDFGLVPALHGFARRFVERTGMSTKVDAVDLYPRLSRNVELALFRIVQEALTNAIKHSGASGIRIRVWRRDSHTYLAVEDNGRGFSNPAGARSVWRGGWGLPEMRKRAEAVGGTLQIEFPGEGGTRVLVHVAADHAD